MRIVTGRLLPTPTDYLPILASIKPAKLRRQGATLFLAYCSMIDPKQLLHQLMVGPTAAHEERFNFRRHFVPIISTEHLSCTMDSLQMECEVL